MPPLIFNNQQTYMKHIDQRRSLNRHIFNYTGQEKNDISRLMSCSEGSVQKENDSNGYNKILES